MWQFQVLDVNLHLQNSSDIKESTGYEIELVEQMFHKYRGHVRMTKKDFVRVQAFIHVYPTCQQVLCVMDFVCGEIFKLL
jgi:hypothetical protein